MCSSASWATYWLCVLVGICFSFLNLFPYLPHLWMQENELGEDSNLSKVTAREQHRQDENPSLTTSPG